MSPKKYSLQDRQAVMNLYLMGWSYARIAREVGRSTSSVRLLLVRERRKERGAWLRVPRYWRDVQRVLPATIREICNALQICKQGASRRLATLESMGLVRRAGMRPVRHGPDAVIFDIAQADKLPQPRSWKMPPGNGKEQQARQWMKAIEAEAVSFFYTGERTVKQYALSIGISIPAARVRLARLVDAGVLYRRSVRGVVGRSYFVFGLRQQEQEQAA